MHNRSWLYFILFAACFTGSCSKSGSVPGRISLLTRKEWKLTDITVTPAVTLRVGTNGNSYTSLFRYYDDIKATCSKGKRLSFVQGAENSSFENGDYILTEKTDCTDQPVLQKGTWNFVENNDKIIYLYLYKNRQSGLINSIYTVEEISGDRLVLTARTNFTGVTGTYTLRYVYEVK